jgi:hypothetical protein
MMGWALLIQCEDATFDYLRMTLNSAPVNTRLGGERICPAAVAGRLERQIGQCRYPEEALAAWICSNRSICRVQGEFLPVVVEILAVALGSCGVEWRAIFN